MEENLIPDDYWNEYQKELTESELEELSKLAGDLNEELESPMYWVEMTEDYFDEMASRLNKDRSEIAQRKFKTYMNVDMPLWIMVMPAGRQHNGSEMVQYFHIIVEDMEYGECNGAYELVTENELLDKFNIKYNN